VRSRRRRDDNQRLRRAYLVQQVRVPVEHLEAAAHVPSVFDTPEDFDRDGRYRASPLLRRSNASRATL
jgi:hypothetical protein